jgi:SAM-dependent methyltransferase
MKRLIERTAAECFEKHSGIPLRIYEGDEHQDLRVQCARFSIQRILEIIDKKERLDMGETAAIGIMAPHGGGPGNVTQSRKFIGKLLGEKINNGPSHKRVNIIELGCGTGDISGFFSWGHSVKGYEASTKAALEAQRRFNWMDVEVCDIQTLPPEDCDLLIMCEILEHVDDPKALVKKWLPHAKFAVVSSPVDGDVQGDMSGGEHSWSFGPGELEGMLIEAGHTVLDATSVPTGAYTVRVVASRRESE